MEPTILVITSIADDRHPVLQKYAKEAVYHGVHLVVVGDAKSPQDFWLHGCEYHSIHSQRRLPFRLAQTLPEGHYARKNLGYLQAMAHGAACIIETDDDNIPLSAFWASRSRYALARRVTHAGWVNAYRYFTEASIWPRGFALDHVRDPIPEPIDRCSVYSPIQQGLADEDPDVDALYRLLMPLPFQFDQESPVALEKGSICPFNSQNTTWFREAFPLLYLPSTCSFRMTDIWRSFVAQRIAWTCDWTILFHAPTVWQERNTHDLMHDLSEEMSGYLHNGRIMEALIALDLKPGVEAIPGNLRRCYSLLVDMDLLERAELEMLDGWLEDIEKLSKPRRR